MVVKLAYESPMHSRSCLSSTWEHSFGNTNLEAGLWCRPF